MRQHERPSHRNRPDIFSGGGTGLSGHSAAAEGLVDCSSASLIHSDACFHVPYLEVQALPVKAGIMRKGERNSMKNYFKSYKVSQAGRKMQSDKVRIEPVFRKPIDIDKLGKAILALTLKQAEDQTAGKTSRLNHGGTRP